MQHLSVCLRFWNETSSFMGHRLTAHSKSKFKCAHVWIVEMMWLIVVMFFPIPSAYFKKDPRFLKLFPRQVAMALFLKLKFKYPWGGPKKVFFRNCSAVCTKSSVTNWSISGGSKFPLKSYTENIMCTVYFKVFTAGVTTLKAWHKEKHLNLLAGTCMQDKGVQDYGTFAGSYRTPNLQRCGDLLTLEVEKACACRAFSCSQSNHMSQKIGILSIFRPRSQCSQLESEIAINQWDGARHSESTSRMYAEHSISTSRM